MKRHHSWTLHCKERLVTSRLWRWKSITFFTVFFSIGASGLRTVSGGRYDGLIWRNHPSAETFRQRNNIFTTIYATIVYIRTCPSQWRHWGEKLLLGIFYFLSQFFNTGTGGFSHFTELHIYNFKIREYYRKFFSMAGWSFNGFVR